MTGRDLIIYIMANGLEDEPVFKDGKFIGFITADDAAVKMEVGTATINALILQKRIESIAVDKAVYIPANFKVKEGKK